MVGGISWEAYLVTVNGHVYWSIYVRTGSVQKLRATHLPEIDKALGPPQFKWQLLNEEESPGLIRLINYQNLSAENVAHLVTPVLVSAYSLGNSWTITGLSDLGAQKLRYVFGGWSMDKPNPRPPAVESMMFEISPGLVSGMNSDGGWMVADEPE